MTSSPGAIPGAGLATFLGKRTKRLPVFYRGRCPRTPAIPGFCARFVRSRPRSGGLLRLCPLLRAGARRRGLSCPRLAAGRVRAPRSALPPSSRRALRARPPGAGLGGWGVGWSLRVPLARSRRALPPLPAAVVWGGLVLWWFGGVLCRSFLLLPPCCAPRGLAWLPGRAPPWAFRSAPRRAPCPGRSLWFASLPRRALARSPVRGPAACRRRVAAAWFARFRSRRASRRRGWFPFRWRRRPFRSVAVARPAPSPPSWPPAAALALSRGGAPVRVRGGPSRRLSCPARAGFGGRGLRGLPLALAGAGRGAARGVVRLARAGPRPARPRLARGRRPAPRPPALPRLAAAGRVRAGRGARPAGLAVAGSPARRFFSFPAVSRSHFFFPPGPPFLGFFWQ